ncbi:MAG: extracellular solute-binding protein [Nitrososphaeraceae archaeon]
MTRYNVNSFLRAGLIMSLALSLMAVASFTNPALLSNALEKKQITLTAMLDDQGDPPRLLNMLFNPALEELRSRHPDLDIKLDYRPIPYINLHNEFSKAMANQTPVDIMTVDHVWLGEFAEKGLLTDLTNLAHSWGREKDWYRANWDGGVYKGKLYAIWTVVDVRGTWYWKDLLRKAGVDPDLLMTWDGYISAAKKLNAVLRPQGIEGVHLVASPIDMWYPYLWEVGGEVIKLKSGHPTKGNYWFPAYNSSEGVRALGFIKAQIDSGIKPQKQHFWGKEFLDRKFAVMSEAVQNHVRNDYNVTTPQEAREFEQKVGMIPMFPVPDPSYGSATLLGGWELGIPQTSKHKDLAWELITTMLEPKIITPMLQKYGLLPTRVSIGEGPSSIAINSSIPYYPELVSMIKIGQTRPNIPEFPQISSNIRQAIDQIYNGTNQPKQALDEAAAKSAKILGW